MFRAVRSQVRVIGALTIRAMQSVGKRLAYGYAWSFLQPIVMIAFFRILMRATGYAPAGMTPMTFLVLGVLSVLTFIRAMGAGARSPRRGMMVIPRVTQLDLFLAQGLLTFITYDILLWLFAVPASIYDGVWPPENALGIQVVFIADWLLGISFGLVWNAVGRLFPPIHEFKRMIVRPLRVISGMFFVIVSIPTSAWPYLIWNPILHVSELMRSYWFTVYTTPVGSLPYIVLWICGLLLLGLSLDRYLRRTVAE